MVSGFELTAPSHKHLTVQKILPVQSMRFFVCDKQMDYPTCVFVIRRKVERSFLFKSEIIYLLHLSNCDRFHWTNHSLFRIAFHTGFNGHKQRIPTYFIRGSITVQLTSCFPGLASTKQINLLITSTWQCCWIQSSRTGGQPHIDISKGVNLRQIWSHWSQAVWLDKNCQMSIKVAQKWFH